MPQRTWSTRPAKKAHRKKTSRQSHESPRDSAGEPKPKGLSQALHSWGPLAAILGLCMLTTWQMGIYLGASSTLEASHGAAHDAAQGGLPPLPPLSPRLAASAIGGPSGVAAAVAVGPGGRAEGQAAASPAPASGGSGGPHMTPSPSVTADGKVKCTNSEGYANSQILRGQDFFDYMSSTRCADRCAADSTCTCWAWKDDGFCRIGVSDECVRVGSTDNVRWRFGICLRGSADRDNPHLRGAAAAAASTASSPVAAALSRAIAVEPPSPTPSLCDAAHNAAASAGGNGTAAKPLGEDEQIPVLIITHARAQYLQRALDSVFRHRKQPERFPVFASQDGDDQGVAKVLEEYVNKGLMTRFFRFAPPKELIGKGPNMMRKGYQRLAAHYRWALDQLMLGGGWAAAYEHLIVLEEDLEIAPDFFNYFEATLPLLRADPCLFCVSAWNDNGKPEIASESKAIFRTDFFPGLGWMLLRSFWLELRTRWPPEYWDDFVRRSDVRQGRQCLRPEVSRTYTFGEVGVSKGQFYNTHLRKMALNKDLVDWKSMDLSFVGSAGRFDDYLAEQIHKAEVVPLEQLGSIGSEGQPKTLVVIYKDVAWGRYAKFFGLMEDMKDGVRRGAYRGVLPITWNRHRIFLVRDWPLSAPAKPS